MFRLALGLEYEGTSYHGWQRQDHHPNSQAYLTVQQQVETALTKIANHPVTTIVAGRTDAGVHAIAQVIHCDVTAQRSAHQWVFGGNRYLPADIRILWAKPVANNFDARRSATFRRYCYVIYNSKIRPVLLRNLVTWYHQELDAALMHAAAQFWLGEHDFSSFRDQDCQSKSPVRRIFSFNIKRNNHLITIEVCANAFLHHMIRNFVGVLIEIGTKKLSIEHARIILQACNRSKAASTAPATGLYLTEVGYPDEFDLPKTSPTLNYLGV